MIFLAGNRLRQGQMLKNQPGAKPTIAVKIEPTPTSTVLGEQKKEYPKTVGNFSILEKEVCFDKERPLVYFFGHSGCPHCQWEAPLIKKVAEQFGDFILFYDYMDKEDWEIFNQYSEVNKGYVPFLMMGCKYARGGSGEKEGEEQEIKNLTAVICKLTDMNPKAVCEPVGMLVKEIK